MRSRWHLTMEQKHWSGFSTKSPSLSILWWNIWVPPLALEAIMWRPKRWTLMKTLLKNFTKSYWNLKRRLGSPFKKPVTRTENDALWNTLCLLWVLECVGFSWVGPCAFVVKTDFWRSLHCRITSMIMFVCACEKRMSVILSVFKDDVTSESS